MSGRDQQQQLLVDPAVRRADYQAVAIAQPNTGAVHASMPPTAPAPASGSFAKRKNPFEYHTPIDAYETIKIIVMCLLGVPLLRIVLILAAVLVLAFLGNLAMLCYAPVSGKRLPRWRRWIVAPIPMLTRLILFFLGFYWIPVRFPDGAKSLDRKNMPRIILCNHITFIEGLFLLYYLSPSIAMKEEVASAPLLGAVVRTIQPILINRKTSEGRKKALQDIADHMASAELPPLLIFPEGTTSNQDYLTRFKVGSFAAGTPCQPVTVRYPYKHFDVSWTPTVSGIYLFFRMICQVYNRLEVEFLPPYYPTEAEKAAPELYADNVRQVMATSLGVDCTNHAFEDVALLLHGNRNYVHEHVVGITDVHEVVHLTSLRGADIDKLVKYFAKHDLNKDGTISLEELQSLFPEDDEELLKRLFTLVDADGNGQIDFRELCLVLRVLSSNSTSLEELTKFAFSLYDVDKNGVVDVHELEQLLAFNAKFYGLSSVTVSQAMDLIECTDGQVTFTQFQRLAEQKPELLGHAKSTIEILRGSLRE